MAKSQWGGLQVDVDELREAGASSAFTGYLAIDVGDEHVFEWGSGFAHRALQVPAVRDTRFGTASIGKAFTALAVMRLVEDGTLTLSTPVRGILGTDLPLIDDAVTIEQLLEHTSGIGDYIDEEADWEPTDYVLPVPVHTLADIEAFVPIIDGFPQVSAPGTRFAYNNGAYVVLAIVVQRVSGREYHRFVEEEVCARAGMVRTGFLRSDDLPGDAALGYLLDEGDQTNVLHLPVRGTGDGGIYSSVDDLHVFWQAFTEGRIVGPDAVAAMIRPRHDVPQEGVRAAMGFYLHPTLDVLMLEGYDSGVSVRTIHDPATRTTATVLGNSSEGAWGIAHRLLAAFG